ncbi:MAG: hypothetical protein AAFX09_11810 [Pseudomonadota bacterium]
MTFKLIPALAAAVALLLVSAPSAIAQSEEADPPDLRQSVLGLRNATLEAARVEDWVSARRTNNAALMIQPGHPRLLNNAVLIAARSGDEAGLWTALETIARAGLVFQLDDLGEAGERLAETDSDRYAALAERLAGNSAPRGQAREFARVPLEDALIEAVAVDIETERLFLGGVAEPGIWRVEPFDPGAPEKIAGAAEGLSSVLGLAVDRRHRLLYVASAPVPQTPGEAPQSTALFAFDLNDASLVRRIEIDGAARIGDVMVAEGVVYASDAEAGRIYRLSAPDAEPEIFSQDSRYVSLQGLAVARGALWAADYAMGLWRIDLADGQARRVESETASLIGLDGLTAGRGDVLFAVRNGADPHALLRITFTGDHTVSAEPVLSGHPAFGEPTQIRAGDGRLFLLANARWAAFPEDEDTEAGEREPARILTLAQDPN